MRTPHVECNDSQGEELLMINTFRLLKMIRLSRYEEGEGGEDLRVCGYYRSDYIGLQLNGTAVLTTVAFGLIAALAVLYDIEGFLDIIGDLDLTAVITLAVVVYAFLMAAYLIITYAIASLRHRRARKSVRGYERELKELKLLGRRTSSIRPARRSRRRD